MYDYFIDGVNLAKVGNDLPKMAAFLSQIAQETNNFVKIESGTLDGNDDDILGNKFDGDGINFQGRGGIYVRGRASYEAANRDSITGGFSNIRLDI